MVLGWYASPEEGGGRDPGTGTAGEGAGKRKGQVEGRHKTGPRYRLLCGYLRGRARDKDESRGKEKEGERGEGRIRSRSLQPEVFVPIYAHHFLPTGTFAALALANLFPILSCCFVCIAAPLPGFNFPVPVWDSLPLSLLQYHFSFFSF